MIDLTTTYLGLKLKNPLVPSSSPLMQSVDNIKRMEDAGAAAVVMHSLFEEQIVNDSLQLDQMLDQSWRMFETLDFSATRATPRVEAIIAALQQAGV